jgi:excisionase family DNA binding protein
MKVWTAAEIRRLGAAIDIVTAGEILGIGRTTAYQLARRGEFPVTVLRIGGRYRVRTADLRTLLAIDDDPETVA